VVSYTWKCPKCFRWISNKQVCDGCGGSLIPEQKVKRDKQQMRIDDVVDF
jgi:rRNA maturation endonuclease Nob1